MLIQVKKLITVLPMLISQEGYANSLREITRCNFYWQQEITPDKEPASNGKEVTLPHSWKTDAVAGEDIGVASYICRFKSKPNNQAISIPPISDTYELYIDGQFRGRFFEKNFFLFGIQSYHSWNLQSLPKGESHELIIIAKNSQGYWSGLYNRFKIGTMNEIHKHIKQASLLDGFANAALFYGSLLNFFIFLLNRQNKKVLSLSLLGFAFVFRNMSLDPHNLIQLIIPLPHLISYRLQCLSFFMAGSLYLTYVHFLYPKVKYSTYCKKLGIALLPVALFSIFLPIEFLRGFTLPVYRFLTPLIFAVFIAYAIYGLVNRLNYAKLQIFSVILWGVLVFFELINTLFFFTNLIPYGLYGAVCYYLIQTLIISMEYNELTRNLVSQQKSNSHLIDQLAKVFYSHQISQMKQGQNLESTMPLGQREAIVLSLDIIGSSKINIDQKTEFLEDLIHSSLSLLNEGYDPENLVSSGFKIKAMGDGFLASVGFPFKTPSSLPDQDFAVHLSIKIIKFIKKIASFYELEHPVNCCIGLAKGDIKAYYPTVGTKEYDLYGEGIVLATRYENMRKSLWGDMNFSALIVQEILYRDLKEETQKLFTEVELSAIDKFVRDDANAIRLYYYKI